jgi:hypothetical protein
LNTKKAPQIKDLRKKESFRPSSWNSVMSKQCLVAWCRVVAGHGSGLKMWAFAPVLAHLQKTQATLIRAVESSWMMIAICLVYCLNRSHND